MTITPLIIDTETQLMRPGVMAPELACVSWRYGGTAKADIIHGRDPALPALLTNWFSNPSWLLGGHNFAYDTVVFCANFPDLIPTIFDAYKNDRVTCTKLREQLLDIAAGQFRGANTGEKWNYDLGSCVYRLRRIELDKDTWRLRYGELLSVPIDQWPEGASEYPKADVGAALDLFESQEARAGAALADQFRQSRFYFAIQLSSVHGIRTNHDKVAQFEREIQAEIDELKGTLVDGGLVRANGTRNMKAAHAAMVEACAELKVEPDKTDGGAISLAKDACEVLFPDGPDVPHENPKVRLMQCYSEYQTLAKVMSNDVTMLYQGTSHPIHPSYGLGDSGRSTCSGPNIQGLRRKAGIRECFEPRKGKLYAQADYEGLELHTMAQACLVLLGYSDLAKALNNRLDVHLQIASAALGISYDEAKQRLKAGDKKVKLYRGGAKPANFGFIDGIGVNTYKTYAKANYGVEIDDPWEIRRVWEESWTEMMPFFAWVKEQLCDGYIEFKEGFAPVGHFKQLYSDRIRSGMTFTKFCSTVHQGLGADAAKNAVWLVQQACYAQPTNVLYGSRLVAFIHDELILEVDDDASAHDKAQELGRLMVLGASPFLPDVPPRTEPLLMRYWSKDAVPAYDQDKRLVAWPYDKPAYDREGKPLQWPLPT